MTKPIQIRKDDVARDIRELAALTGEAITEAVAEAVRERLDRVRRFADRDARDKRIDRIIADFQAAVKAHGGRPLTDDDLYDENGLPK